MKKKVKVVILPTEKATLLGKRLEFNTPLTQVGDLAFMELNSTGDLEWEHQHLYLVSDEEIKEGDWFISPLGNVIKFEEGGMNPYTDVTYDAKSMLKKSSKIVATTDKLEIPIRGEFYGEDRIVKLTYLPQIPESFIKTFVEANGEIDEVEVEMEKLCIQTGKPCGMPCLSEETCEENISLKLIEDKEVVIYLITLEEKLPEN